MHARRLLGLAALVYAFALIAVAAAHAKGPLQFCGADRCVTLGAEQDATEVLLGRSAPVAAGSAPAAYYTLRFGDVGGVVAYWVPSARLLRLGQAPGDWRRIQPAAEALLTRSATGLEPRAAPAAASVMIGQRIVAESAGYLRLFRAGTRARKGGPATGWTRIDVFGGESPWTDGLNPLWIARSGPFLKRGAFIYRVTPALAARVRAGHRLVASG